VHGASEEKNDYSKECFYLELGQVFVHYPKYNMKIIQWDYN
jgi:hypothetical protein